MKDTMKLIPYVQAQKLLNARLKATPHEIAMWCCLGAPEIVDAATTRAGTSRQRDLTLGLGTFDKNGHPCHLRDYISTMPDEPDDDPEAEPAPPYLEALHRIYFDRDEAEAFEPAERYLTWTELRARWAKRMDEAEVTPFITARLNDSELMTGFLRPRSDLVWGLHHLFAESRIKAIEAHHFDGDPGGSVRLGRRPVLPDVLELARIAATKFYQQHPNARAWPPHKVVRHGDFVRAVFSKKTPVSESVVREETKYKQQYGVSPRALIRAVTPIWNDFKSRAGKSGT
jgi:hypothetical protein